MTNTQASWNDQKIEQIIGVLLRVGVSMSAALVFVAGLLTCGRTMQCASVTSSFMESLRS